MLSLKHENPHQKCLCAPVSNESLERLFSQMNIIKFDVRNRLSNKALNAVLCIRTSGITIDDFHNDHVYKCVNFWYNKKKRRKTKTKENAKMQRKPSEAAKRPKFDIYKSSAQIEVLSR